MKLTSNNTIMALFQTSRFGKVVIQSAFMAFISLAAAHSMADGPGSILALGRVESTGTLARGVTTLEGGATITSTRVSKGSFTVTLRAPGAFGDVQSINEFLIEASVDEFVSGDDLIRAQAGSFTTDELVVRFYIDDVEDEDNTSASSPRDLDFVFAIHRISGGLQPAETKFLLATGRANEAGGGNAVAVDGATVTSNRIGTGKYEITVRKPGAFTDDGSDDYVPIFTVESLSTVDTGIHGRVESVQSDDEVVFSVRTDDLEDSANLTLPDPIDSNFYFTIYRIPSNPDEILSPPRSALALARMTVRGFNGTLSVGGSSIPGATVNVREISDGRYAVNIAADGFFAGKSANDFVLQCLDNASGSNDDLAHADVILISDNNLAVEVFIDDVEVSGDAGVPVANNFFLSVYDGRGEFRPDLRIGKQRSVLSHRGNDRYNSSGAGQKLRVPLKGTARRKFHLSVQNDGNVGDMMTLKAKKAGRDIQARYFTLSGGRRDVTAEVLTGRHRTGFLAPNEVSLYQAKVRYRDSNRRPSKKLKYTTRSTASSQQIDVNQAVLKPKK